MPNYLHLANLLALFVLSKTQKMSLIQKFKTKELANIANLKPQTSNITSYITDLINNPTSCTPFDFEVYLPTKGTNLQRELVWTLEQKKELIKSIILEREINQPS